jgi:gliding motility-associated-like protein
VVTLNLTINTFASGTDVQTACDSLTWIDGITYTASTTTPTFTIIGGSSTGCDSVVTLNLTINTFASGTDVQTTCDSLTWIDGITYTASTTTPTFTIVGGSSAGCDSVVTLNLTINTFASGTDTQTACNSYTWIDGTTYTVSTTTPTFTIVGGSSAGCDSVVTLNLTINTTVTSTDIQTACNSYTWIDGVTYTASTNLPTATFIGGASNGCDSIVTLNLTITTPSSTTQTFNECEGFSVTVGTNTYTTTGIYTDVVNNCDTIITDLTIVPTPIVNLTNDHTIIQGSSTILTATGGGTYLWSPVTDLSCTNCASTIATPLATTTYCVEVSNNGCTINECVNVTVDIECGELFVPNGFSPNGDGNNDVLEVKINQTCVTSFNIKIYDRWGEKVFESDNINNSWDGTYNGKPLNSAVFVYYLNIGLINSEEGIFKKGDVSIIK